MISNQSDPSDSKSSNIMKEVNADENMPLLISTDVQPNEQTPPIDMVCPQNTRQVSCNYSIIPKDGTTSDNLTSNKDAELPFVDKVNSILSSYSIDSQNPPKANQQYNTFTDKTLSKIRVGLTSSVARKRLLDTLLSMLAKHRISSRRSCFNSIFCPKDFSFWVQLFCGLYRTFSFIAFDLEKNELQMAYLFESILIISGAFLHYLLTSIRCSREEEEMAERVENSVVSMLTHHLHEVKEKCQSKGRINPKMTLLAPSSSFINVYRDNTWQRIPTNLLVEGDAIALISGDVFPGDVELLNHTPARLCRRGEKVIETSKTEEKMMSASHDVTFDVECLLDLCGDMHVYEMKETPIVKDIAELLKNISASQRPDSLFQKQFQKAKNIMSSLFFVFVIFSTSVCFFRFLLLKDLYCFEVLFRLGLVFSFMGLPLVLLLGEAAGTSRILSTFESLQRKKRNEEEMEVLGDLDVEEREHLRSTRAHHFKTGRSWKHFLRILQFRLMKCSRAHHSFNNRQSGKDADKYQAEKKDPFLVIPFSSIRLLERLGSITMVCCVDDEVLCDRIPCVDEVFLLNDEQGNKTVLDLHAQSNSGNSVKFEDVGWKKHLPCLKPIGLAILLTERMALEKQLTYLSSSSSLSTDSSAFDHCFRKCLERLSAHIRLLPNSKEWVDLAKEIGFSSLDLQYFERHQMLHILNPPLAHLEHTSDLHAQTQQDLNLRGNINSHLMSSIVLDKRSGGFQLLSRGHPELVLKQCSTFWDGKSICHLSSQGRNAILEMYHQWKIEDLDCIALSYAPLADKYQSVYESMEENPFVYLISEDTNEKEKTEKEKNWKKMQQDQIFCGMAASCIQPKKEVSGMIEDLTHAGVRFVYFSPRNMKRSKSLAEKMGIEMDWNCAISLRNLPSDAPDPHRMTSHYSDWDVKARLPHGIHAIREHLANVDNVPLLVSLYTDSTCETILDMLKIFQEHEEMVLVVGSGLVENNAQLFAQADLSMAIQSIPSTLFHQSHDSQSSTSSLLSTHDLDISQSLNALSCAFSIPHISFVIDLLRLGRKMIFNYRQLFVFFFLSHLYIVCIIFFGICHMLSNIASLPPGGILYICWIVIPCICLSFLASPSSKNIWNTTPPKNEPVDLSPDLFRWTCYLFFRFIPSLIFSIVTFFWSLTWWRNINLHQSAIYQHLSPHSQPVYQSQSLLLLLTVCFIIFTSSSSLYRQQSLFVENVFRNLIWLMTCTLLLSLQIIYTVYILPIKDIPYLFYILFFIWIIFLLAIDEFVKIHDRHVLKRYYKFLRMQFDTRLGMWSPR